MMKRMSINELELITGGEGKPQYEGGFTDSAKAALKRSKRLTSRSEIPTVILDGLIETGKNTGDYIDVGFSGPRIG